MTTSNPLTELIPAAYRRYVYVVAAAAVFLYGIWQAVDGDYKAFAIAVASALVPALAASNTKPNEQAELESEEAEDPDFYDGDGGL